MTWLGDPNGGLKGPEKEKLLLERDVIVAEVKALSIKPIPPNRPALTRGRQEDLINLAKKIKGIDKKLGRITE